MIVYKITNLINGKSYIGITRMKLWQRWKAHRWAASHGADTPLHRAIRKHGIAAFHIAPICECSSLIELAACEKGLIAQYGTLVPSGYNATSGGDGCWNRIISEETRDKYRAAAARRKAEGTWFIPRKTGEYHHSDEVRAKLSARLKGRAPPKEMMEKARLVNLGKKYDASRVQLANRRAQESRLAKLSPERKALIAEVKWRVAAGERHCDIARKLGLNAGQVWHMNSNWQEIAPALRA